MVSKEDRARPATPAFYTSQRTNGQSLIQAWAAKGEVGASITPSVHIPSYRSRMAKYIASLCDTRKLEKLVSIGCGPAFVERELLSNYRIKALCTDVLEEFLAGPASEGLETKAISAFELSKVGEAFDLIYLDGVMGHLSEERNYPHCGCLGKIFSYLMANLSENGVILTSDDCPYQQNRLEVHAKMPHYRFADELFFSEAKSVGLQPIDSWYFEFERPSVGNVIRRVCTFERL